MLRRLPLRSKLITTIAIPVALLMVVAFVVVGDRSSIADARSAERAGVERATALLDVVTALQAERNVLLSPDTTNDDLADSRRALDLAIAEVLAPAFDLEPARVDDVTDLRDRVAELRAIAGDDMNQFRQTLGLEIQEGRTREPGTNSQVILTMNPLTIGAIEFVSFAPDTQPSVEASDDIRSTKLLTHLQEAVFQEITGYALLAQQQLPNTSAVAAYVNSQGASTELWQNALIEFGAQSDRSDFDAILESPELAAVAETRDLLRSLEPEAPVVFDVPTVMGATQNLVGGIEQKKLEILDRVSDRAESQADDARNDRALVIFGAVALLVGLFALLTGLYRSIRRPIVELTARSNDIADVELPATVRRFREEAISVDDIDIDVMEAEADDEVGQLVGAFNAMHETAVQLASEQAGSRRIVGDMFVNLGRRNQKLLNRLLSSLDALERDEEDPDILEELFRVDHLATRMRRNAESLLILAGAQSPRQWEHSIDVTDVVRAALSEVEEFERVDVNVVHAEKVIGSVVADLAHTLAELIENSLTFSHPESRVEIVARWSRRGYQVTVTDAGLGIADDELARLNDRIRNAATADETPSRYLGLYVVGRLAGRHGFDIGLFEAPEGGTTARIVIGEESLDRRGVEGEITDPKEIAVLATSTSEDDVEALEKYVHSVAERRSLKPSTVQTVPATLDEALPSAPDSPSDAGIPDPVATTGSLVRTDAMPQRRPGAHVPTELQVAVTSPAAEEDAVETPSPAVGTVDGATSDLMPRRTPGTSIAGLGLAASPPQPETAAQPIDDELADPLHVAHVFDAFSSGTAKAEQQLEGGESDE